MLRISRQTELVGLLYSVDTSAFFFRARKQPNALERLLPGSDFSLRGNLSLTKDSGDRERRSGLTCDATVLSSMKGVNGTYLLSATLWILRCDTDFKDSIYL